MFRQAVQKSITGLRQHEVTKAQQQFPTFGRRFTTAAEAQPNPATNTTAQSAAADATANAKQNAPSATSTTAPIPESKITKDAQPEIKATKPFEQAQEQFKKQVQEQQQQQQQQSNQNVEVPISSLPSFIQQQIAHAKASKGNVHTRFVMEESHIGADGKVLNTTYRGSYCPEKGLQFTQKSTDGLKTLESAQLPPLPEAAGKDVRVSTGLPPLPEAAFNAKGSRTAAEADAEYLRRLAKAAYEQERLMGVKNTHNGLGAQQQKVQQKKPQLKQSEGDFESEFTDLDRLLRNRGDRTVARIESEWESELRGIERQLKKERLNLDKDFHGNAGRFERDFEHELEHDFDPCDFISAGGCRVPKTQFPRDLAFGGDALDSLRNPRELRKQVNAIQKQQRLAALENENLLGLERIAEKQAFLEAQQAKLARLEAQNAKYDRQEAQNEARRQAQSHSDRLADEAIMKMREEVRSAVEKGANHAKIVQKLAQEQTQKQQDRQRHDAAQKYGKQQRDDARKFFKQQKEQQYQQYQQQKEQQYQQYQQQKAAQQQHHHHQQQQQAAAAAQAAAAQQKASQAAQPQQIQVGYYQPEAGFSPSSFFQWAHDLHKNMDQFQTRVNQLEQLTSRLHQQKRLNHENHHHHPHTHAHHQQAQDQINAFFGNHAPFASPFAQHLSPFTSTFVTPFHHYHPHPNHHHFSAPFHAQFPGWSGRGGFPF